MTEPEIAEEWTRPIRPCPECGAYEVGIHMAEGMTWQTCELCPWWEPLLVTPPGYSDPEPGPTMIQSEVETILDEVEDDAGR